MLVTRPVRVNAGAIRQGLRYAHHKIPHDEQASPLSTLNKSAIHPVSHHAQVPVPRVDNELFLRWIQPYTAMLRGFFRRRIGNHHDAEDALQDTWLRLLKYRERPALEAPKALAFRVAETVLTDRHRRRISRRGDQHVGLGDLETHGTAAHMQISSTPETTFDASQTLAVLTDAVRALPPRCRQVFLLNRLHGWPRQKIAERLGISIQAVDKQLGRAMTHCRQALGGRQ